MFHPGQEVYWYTIVHKGWQMKGWVGGRVVALGKIGKIAIIEVHKKNWRTGRWETVQHHATFSTLKPAPTHQSVLNELMVLG
jgi:hypothetical protein